jgi:leader peptidase (prepilin peptidase) / N-methyltransferase
VAAVTLPSMEAARAGAFAVAGLLGGSFLTVLVHRLPRREPVAAGRSRCPQCGAQILARDNVPLLSYLALGGRCRTCHTSISASYPATEAVTAALFVVVGMAVRDVWLAAMAAPFCGAMLAASLIDVRHRIIPNRLVYPSLVVFGVVVVALGVAGKEVSPLRAVLGLLAYGGGLLLVALVSPGGMGLGDVKLAALIGLVLGALGWTYVGVGAMAAVLAGGVGAVAALLAGRSRKDAIPFGPYLAGGAVIALLAAPPIAGWYGGLIR